MGPFRGSGKHTHTYIHTYIWTIFLYLEILLDLIIIIENQRETYSYFRKLFVVVCQNNKYGYFKYGRKCDKIHLTDICEQNECCRETYQCDKRHPYRCSYFDKYGSCKFGSFCAYTHVESKETQLQKEIRKTNNDIIHLKN